jgi:hypothetical protein
MRLTSANALTPPPDMPLPDPFTLLLIAMLGFLVAGALSPLEALGWWAGWYGHDLSAHDLPPDTSLAASEKADPEHFIVFLSGIHSVSDETFTGREINLLERLKERLPRATIIEIFPYSVTNRALTGQRTFARVWRWAFRHKLNGRAFAGFLINLRNFWQVAVSADRRYGPIYNQGSAELILRGLERHGYDLEGHRPVTLIGYSGGGQIAAGAAPYLKEILDAPLQVVSLGGVISSDPGLLSLDSLYHLYGSRDNVQRLGNVFFPGRWPILPYSPWNRAKERGIIRLVPTGPVDHTGEGGYLDSRSILPDGRSHLEYTVEIITRIIEESPPAPSTPARAATS